MSEPKLLIAEDDPQIREALERIFTFEGYRVQTANDGAQALSEIDSFNPDVVILDVMMPFVDGLTVCQRIRSRGDRRPILMLTARQELSDRVAGLDAGADDYVSKPFETEELLARIRALVRRVTPSEAAVLTAGPIQIDLGAHRVLVSPNSTSTGPFLADQAVEVDVTKTEFAILELLMRNLDIVMERSTMYDRIWGYDFDGASRALDVHLGYLRRKLEATGAMRTIHTVRGIGFVLRTK